MIFGPKLSLCFTVVPSVPHSTRPSPIIHCSLRNKRHGLRAWDANVESYSYFEFFTDVGTTIFAPHRLVGVGSRSELDALAESVDQKYGVTGLGDVKWLLGMLIER